MKEFLSRIKLSSLIGHAIYMFVVLLIQDMMLPQLSIMGVCPMILPAAAVAVAIFSGAEQGVIFSLIMGIFADMAFVESTVTFTLMLPVLAFGAGFVAKFFINKRFFAYMLIAAGALLVMGIVQMVRVIAADGLSGALLSTLLLQTVWSLPLAAALYLPPAKWIS